MAQEPSSRIAELEARFREITRLLYDTRVPRALLRERVHPHLAPHVTFVDPWVIVHGKRAFVDGLAGFHCIIYFDFEIFQVAVHLDEHGERGRAMVDGVMNLRQLRFYTYPLRTILVYDFTLFPDGVLLIEKLEELWSYGDMIANAPLLVGRFYNRVFRPAAGRFFLALFRAGCALFGDEATRERRRR